MTGINSQAIQSAVALVRRGRAIEAAIRGEDVEPDAVPPSQAVLFRSLSTELHSVLDCVAEETVPMRFGRVLGELWFSFEKGGRL